MIDCHCHLADDAFESDLGEVVERAKTAGVIGAVVCPEFTDQFDAVMNLTERFPSFCFPAIGIHPVQKNWISATMSDVEPVGGYFDTHNHAIVAVGEVGLDFTPRYLTATNAKEEQISVLQHQAEIAKKYGLPLNVHSRSAGRQVIEVLRECNAENVLLHAFGGKVTNALPGIDAGFYFSVPPAFSVDEPKAKLIDRIPMSQLCLESDSPVLGVNKEERNEPKNIALSAAFISKIKKLPLDEVIRITTENALKLFPKLKSLRL